MRVGGSVLKSQTLRPCSSTSVLRGSRSSAGFAGSVGSVGKVQRSVGGGEGRSLADRGVDDARRRIWPRVLRSASCRTGGLGSWRTGGAGRPGGGWGAGLHGVGGGRHTVGGWYGDIGGSHGCGGGVGGTYGRTGGENTGGGLTVALGVHGRKGGGVAGLGLYSGRFGGRIAGGCVGVGGAGVGCGGGTGCNDSRGGVVCGGVGVSTGGRSSSASVKWPISVLLSICGGCSLTAPPHRARGPSSGSQ